MSDKTRRYIKAVAVRAIKTFCQSAVSLITVGSALADIDWLTVLSVSATAMILSILTSFAGLPEVEKEDE